MGFEKDIVHEASLECCWVAGGDAIYSTTHSSKKLLHLFWAEAFLIIDLPSVSVAVVLVILVTQRDGKECRREDPLCMNKLEQYDIDREAILSTKERAKERTHNETA